MVTGSCRTGGRPSGRSDQVLEGVSEVVGVADLVVGGVFLDPGVDGGGFSEGAEEAGEGFDFDTAEPWCDVRGEIPLPSICPANRSGSCLREPTFSHTRPRSPRPDIPKLATQGNTWFIPAGRSTATS